MTHSRKNGRIVDGLTLFTKNVTLHFSGQVECAICYSYALLFLLGLSPLFIFIYCVRSRSIISVMDASLPQKPCKTCKNRFHASCLYKASSFETTSLLRGLDHAWDANSGLKQAIHRAARSVGLTFCKPSGRSWVTWITQHHRSRSHVVFVEAQWYPIVCSVTTEDTVCIHLELSYLSPSEMHGSSLSGTFIIYPSCSDHCSSSVPLLSPSREK